MKNVYKAVTINAAVEIRRIPQKTNCLCEWNLEAPPTAAWAFEPCEKKASYEMEILGKRYAQGRMAGGISFIMLCRRHFEQFIKEMWRPGLGEVRNPYVRLPDARPTTRSRVPRGRTGSERGGRLRPPK